MKTKEQMMSVGISENDAERSLRTQRVYDFALSETRERVPEAPEYLVQTMVRELLLEAAGQRRVSVNPRKFSDKPLLWGKHCRGPGCDDFNQQRPSCSCDCCACKP